MPTGGLVVFAGITIMFVSFVFGAINMMRTVRGSGRSPDLFNKGFRRHIGAMIGMAAGGFVAFVGVALLVVRYLER